MDIRYFLLFQLNFEMRNSTQFNPFADIMLLKISNDHTGALSSNEKSLVIFF